MTSRAKASSSKASSAKAPLSRPQSTAEETLKTILARLDDLKAEETVTIDLNGKSSIGDYIVVTTGRSNRHVGALADNVMQGLHATGLKTRVEGMQNCDWVLIDAGDVLVHVFRPEVREFYNLERMWTGTAGRRQVG